MSYAYVVKGCCANDAPDLMYKRAAPSPHFNRGLMSLRNLQEGLRGEVDVPLVLDLLGELVESVLGVGVDVDCCPRRRQC